MLKKRLHDVRIGVVITNLDKLFLMEPVMGLLDGPKGLTLDCDPFKKKTIHRFPC